MCHNNDISQSPIQGTWTEDFQFNDFHLNSLFEETPLHVKYEISSYFTVEISVSNFHIKI